jgi:DNA-binding transcriptional MerR regulator
MRLLTTQAVAQMLDLTPDAVRYHERRGHILAIKVDRGTTGPMRLFVQEDIERFQRQRAERLATTTEGEGEETAQEPPQA